MEITQVQIDKGQEMYYKLVQRAWNDANFKEGLLNEPLETLENFTGNKLPKGTHILVEDQSDKAKVYLNIPKKIDFNNIELSDEQLENVSGGDFGLGILIVGIVSLHVMAFSAGASLYTCNHK
jgi:hypothetical protein